MPYIRTRRYVRRRALAGLGQDCGTDPCGWFDWYVWTTDACKQYMSCAGLNATVGQALGTCTTDPTAPLGQQCASVAGVAQTMTGELGTAVEDIGSAAQQAVTGTVTGLTSTSGGSVLLIAGVLVGGLVLMDILSPPKGRRR